MPKGSNVVSWGNQQNSTPLADIQKCHRESGLVRGPSFVDRSTNGEIIVVSDGREVFRGTTKQYLTWLHLA